MLKITVSALLVSSLFFSCVHEKHKTKTETIRQVDTTITLPAQTIVNTSRLDSLTNLYRDYLLRIEKTGTKKNLLITEKRSDDGKLLLKQFITAHGELLTEVERLKEEFNIKINETTKTETKDKESQLMSDKDRLTLLAIATLILAAVLLNNRGVKRT